MNPQIAYLLNTSIQQIESGRLDDAERTLGQILKIQPKNADALSFLSVVSAYRFDFDQALVHISKAIECDPKNSNALSNKGNILKELGRLDEAESAYKKAILLDSKNPEAFNNLGNLQQDLGHYSEAIENYEKAIKLVPNYAEAYSNKGNALEKIGRYEESLRMYEKAISIKPNYADAWLNQSFTLNKLKRFENALISCDTAIAIDPQYPLAWNDKGVILSENGFHQESIKFYDQAILLNQDFEKAWASRGSSLVELKEYKEALLSYEKAYFVDGNLDFVLGDIINLKLLIGVWQQLDDDIQTMVKGVWSNEKVINPHKFLSAVDSLEGALSSAKKWVTNKFPPKDLLPQIEKKAHQKIRIGYFSADFKNHPVSLLTVELFELHNRDQFEIFAFSLKGADKNDEIRARLILAFDKFIDVETKTEIEVAQIARELEIDIAVDLGGHTQFAPTGTMSYRAAPIQVNYLGYPGTMGAEYIDYIIADPILIPKEAQQYYSEKVAYLPDTYIVDDSARLPSNTIFTRQDLGLPDSGFVFCCFNNSYKFNKQMLESWIHILNAAPNSVLWISENNEIFRENLAAEFSKLGIDSSRIIFAKKLDSLADHLARLSAADLFLDTYPYNAHTTAVDALKAGVPVLTYMGQAFAGRVAASLLNAVGLPELVTNSLGDYEKIAIEMALNPDKLLILKTKLAENRKKKALFNTPRFVKNIESAYIEMYKKYLTEMPVDHIYIEAS